MAAPRSQPNVLAGPYLQRASLSRKDEARLLAALADPRTQFVPVWRTRNLVSAPRGGFSAHFLSRTSVLASLPASEFIFLGEFHERAVFAFELTDDMPQLDTAEVEFRDLRTIAGELPSDEAGLLAYARAMVYWRERHRYCGRCGSPTGAVQAGHVRQCGNPSCGLQQFPRIDPAVIVLITDGERALLGRQPSWPPGRYSTIAGFVEPGESLEDAVAREVREETGVELASIDYHSSQPWPFPSSLMLGFTALAATTAIQRVDDELEDARWVSRAELASGVVALPTTHSISFRLIEDWYDAGAARPLREEPGVRMWQRPSERV
jgi:NAD+ diphosphatase